MTLGEILCYNINSLNLNLNININQISCEQDAHFSDYIKKYITIIGQSISIFSLLLLIIIYLHSKVLRNGPGKILICQSVSLLLSQLCFLTSIYITKPYVFYHKKNSNQTQCNELENSFERILETIISSKSFDCYLMSMLSHYFHLAFFLWSNIMAYDLFKTFTVLSSSKNSKNFITNNEDKRIQFLKYSLVGWLFPLTIVTVLLFFQFLFNQMVYGFKTCFISSQLNLLLFFVLPVCVLLCLNLFFLISSIKSIRGVDKLSKKYLKKDEDLSSNLISNTTQTTSTITKKIRLNRTKSKNRMRKTTVKLKKID